MRSPVLTLIVLYLFSLFVIWSIVSAGARADDDLMPSERHERDLWRDGDR